MRDVIFALQGIDGQYIKFDVIADGYTVDRKVRTTLAVYWLTMLTVYWLCIDCAMAVY